MLIERLNTRLVANPKKVILQFFSMNSKRTIYIINRVIFLDEFVVRQNLENVYAEFSHRHKLFEETLISHYEVIRKFVPCPKTLSDERKLLIGSYFTKEYSIQSAALFNPSIVPHPDQGDNIEGELKFVMSLRSTGEGHISSIEFREGIISNDGEIRIINDSTFSFEQKKIKYQEEDILSKKLHFTDGTDADKEDILDSNYKLSFSDYSSLSERVLTPNSQSEKMGLEDARFVKFYDKGESKYYGTYTAYNGKKFRTQIIETNDFRNFKIGTLHGSMVQDKGMALFPRKLNGKYAIISRHDGENLFLMKSDELYSWNSADLLLEPKNSWAFVQLGNCGSPIETEKGWLLITHAVGPMRKYVLSAVLLDVDNPGKIIGSLKEPLIQPNEFEREGYVPNVIYSCGSLIHNKKLIIPYAMSDSACGFAKVDIDVLLENLSYSNYSEL